MVEVLDKRFLKRSRPRRIFRVAETRVVVWGATVVKGLDTRFRLKRDRFLNKFSRPLPDDPGLVLGLGVWLVLEAGDCGEFWLSLGIESDSDLYYGGSIGSCVRVITSSAHQITQKRIHNPRRNQN